MQQTGSAHCCLVLSAGRVSVLDMSKRDTKLSPGCVVGGTGGGEVGGGGGGESEGTMTQAEPQLV